jgi:riboflavin transporter FmnP
MTIAPGMLLTIVSIIFNAIILVMASMGLMSTGQMIASSASSIVFCLVNYMLFMFLFGVLTTFTEWDNIHTTSSNKVKYMFTFPLFMITYIPIAIAALFMKPEWKPIKHNIAVNVSEYATAQSHDKEEVALR